ncbi:MAG: hypothetical protein OXP74_11500 [Acidobacteriota bacterium]|nr:hypothetical protein [Acidobacteriota bacterium]
MKRGRFALLALVPMFLAVPAFSQDGDENENERVKGAHENQSPEARQDDLGITVPVPTSHPGRRYPAEHEFPTGPAIGERLPEFELPNQDGELIDFHADRGNSKAVVVFYRSAVW